MPVNFKNNGDDKRNLYKFADYIYEQNGEKIYAKLKENINYYILNCKNQTENIIFME